MSLPIILNAENRELIELRIPAIRNPNNRDPSMTRYKGILSKEYPANFNVTSEVFWIAKYETTIPNKTKLINVVMHSV